MARVSKSLTLKKALVNAARRHCKHFNHAEFRRGLAAGEGDARAFSAPFPGEIVGFGVSANRTTHSFASGYVAGWRMVLYGARLVWAMRSEEPEEV